MSGGMYIYIYTYNLYIYISIQNRLIHTQREKDGVYSGSPKEELCMYIYIYVYSCINKVPWEIKLHIYEQIVWTSCSTMQCWPQGIHWQGRSEKHWTFADLSSCSPNRRWTQRLPFQRSWTTPSKTLCVEGLVLGLHFGISSRQLLKLSMQCPASGWLAPTGGWHPLNWMQTKPLRNMYTHVCIYTFMGRVECLFDTYWLYSTFAQCRYKHVYS